MLFYVIFLTWDLQTRIHSLFLGDIQVNYRVEVNAEEAAVIVLDEVVAVKITLTSPLLREACENASKPEEGSAAAATEDAEADFLPREPCLRVRIVLFVFKDVYLILFF